MFPIPEKNIFLSSAMLHVVFLNQAHAWFLKIASVRKCLYVCVFACVCVHLQGY